MNWSAAGRISTAGVSAGSGLAKKMVETSRNQRRSDINKAFKKAELVDEHIRLTEELVVSERMRSGLQHRLEQANRSVRESEVGLNRAKSKLAAMRKSGSKLFKITTDDLEEGFAFWVIADGFASAEAKLIASWDKDEDGASSIISIEMVSDKSLLLSGVKPK